MNTENLEQANKELIARVTDYLCAGGLFNPELMEHDKVRTLLMDYREHMYRLPLKGSPDMDGTLRLYSIFHLQEIGKISESFAAKMVGCDVVSYRMKREQMEAEMQYLISAEMIAMQTDILARAGNACQPNPAYESATHEIDERGVLMARSMHPRHQG